MQAHALIAWNLDHHKEVLLKQVDLVLANPWPDFNNSFFNQFECNQFFQEMQWFVSSSQIPKIIGIFC